MPFNYQTNQWEDLPLDPSFFSLLSQGRDPIAPVIRQPTVEQPAMQEEPMGRVPQPTPWSGSGGPPPRYGGAGGDALNSMDRSSDINRRSHQLEIDTWKKEQDRTAPRRAQERADLEALQRQLFDYSKGPGATNYQTPEMRAEVDRNIQRMIGSLGAMRGSQTADRPMPTYSSTDRSGVDAALAQSSALDAASRKEVTARAMAEAMGFPTPPGGSPPTGAEAAGVQNAQFAKAEQARKDKALAISQQNANSMGAVRDATVKLKERLIRGDVTYPEAVRDLPIMTKAISDMTISLATIAESERPQTIQNIANLSATLPQLQAIVDAGLRQTTAGMPPAAAPPNKEPESSGNWLGQGLSWLAERAGLKSAPAQGQPPQSRQQASQQAYAPPPPMSNAVRKGMELQKRMDSGQASNEDKATYNHWYSIYTDLLAKKIPQIQAVETASKAVFGSF